MDALGHYREAERLLAEARRLTDAGHHLNGLAREYAEAQVHATLAQAGVQDQRRTDERGLTYGNGDQCERDDHDQPGA